MLKYLTLFSVVALSGCGSLKMQQYMPPTEGELATIKVQPVDTRPLSAFTYETPASCTGRKMLKHVGISTPDPVSIRANQDVSLTLIWDTSSTFNGVTVEVLGCTPTITFKPKPNKKYTVTPASKEINTCDLLLTESGDTVPVVSKTYIKGFDENSSFCE